MAKAPDNKIIQEPAFIKLSDAFKKHRNKKGFQKVGIARAIGMGEGRVASFESAMYNPTLLTFIRMCNSIGLKIQLVNDGKGKKTASRKISKKIALKRQQNKTDPGKIIDEMRADWPYNDKI